MDTNSVSTQPARRRRRLRRACVVAASLSLLALLLYAALPWLIPTRWIAGQLHYTLSELTGRPVRIERVSIGWRQGVVIEGLTIARKPAYGDGQMLRVGRARCGFTPLRTLLSGQVDRLVIQDADCWAIIGPDGRLNLTDLGTPSAASAPGRLPAPEWQLDDIRLHLVSNLPDQPELVLDFGSLTCQFDPKSGEARYSADATLAGATGTSASRILWDGKLSIPSLNPGVTLEGGTEFRFTQLDLSSLPTWVWPDALGIETVRGSSSGRLATSLDDRDGIRFTVDIDLHDVTTRRRGMDQPDDIGGLSLDVEGGYRADSRAFRLQHFSLNVPRRLSIEGPLSEASALTYAPLDREWLSTDFRIHTADVSSLIELSPLMAALQDRHITVSGPGTVDVSLSAGANGARWSLESDLTGVRCIAPQIYHLPEGTRANMRLIGEFDRRDDTLLINDLTIRLGEDHFHLQARLPGAIPAEGVLESEDEILKLFERGELRIDASLARAETLIHSIPPLARVLGGAEISGPVRAEIEHRPAGGAPRLDWRLTLPAPFRCIADPYVRLNGSHPVIASGHVRFADAVSGAPGRMGMDLRTGDAHVHIPAEQSSWRFAAIADGADDASPIEIDAHAHLPVEIEGLESLLACSPRVAEALADRIGPACSLGGSCRADLTVNAFVAADEQKYRLAGTLNGDSLAVRLDDWLQKPAPSPARAECGWSFERAGSSVSTQFDATVALSGIHVAGWWTRTTDADDASVSIRVADAFEAARLSPELARHIESHRVSGTMSVTLAGHATGADAGGSISADVTGLAFEIPGRMNVTKRAGVPLTATARVLVAGDPNDLDAWQLDVSDAHVAIGGSRIAVSTLSTRVARGAPEAPGAAPGAWGIESLVARGDADLMVDGSLLGVNPELDEWLRQYDCAGRASAAFSFDYDDRGAVALDWAADATRLHVNAAPVWMKPAGVLVESRGRARLALQDGANVHVTVERIDGRVGATGVIVRGDCALNASGDGDVLGPWSLDVQADCVALDEWAVLLGRLRDAKPTGSAIVHLDSRGDAFRLHAHETSVRFANAAFDLADERIWLDGDLLVTADRMATDGLRLRVGDSDLAVVGAVESPFDAPAGELLLRSDRLDVDAIGEWVGRVAGNLPERAAPPTPEDPEGLWRRIDAASLSAHLHAEKAWFTEPTTGRRFLVDEMLAEPRLAGGILDAPVRCSVNGGVIEGRIGFDRTRTPAMFLLDYEAREVRPLDTGTGVDVRPFLALTFPGLEPTGPITLLDSTRQRLLDPVSPDNHPVGAGELIIEGGVVTGKAAPDYITQLFPKLDFARFEFTRMHDWFEKSADGAVKHHFVFRGPIYHIYADGVSTADRRIRYEVGVDFLASFDKESWAKTGQGRLPLFIKEGAITEDGRLDNEQVRYVPLWKLVNTIFVSNNIIETSYLALREQIRRSGQ